MTEEERVLSLLDFLRIREESEPPPNQIPSSDQEWDAWLDCAFEQAIVPFLYFRIKENNLNEIVPDQIMLRLKQEYHQNAARNLRLLKELTIVVNVLNGKDIPVIPLKGSFVAFHVYTNPALRVMSDIDILVPLPKVRNAVSALHDAGYNSLIPPWEEAAHHTVLQSKNNLFFLEVHWRLSAIANDRALSVDELWANASEQKYMEGKISVFTPEDLLIHICQHTAISHLFTQGIRALCDIDVLVRKYEHTLNWKNIASKAQAWKLHNSIGLILILAKQYLNTPLPQDAVHQLKINLIDSKIVHEAIHQIASAAEDPNLPSDPFATKVLARILSEKNISRMLILLFKSIFRPMNVSEEVFLPENKHAFNLRRILYLLKKYSGYAWNYFVSNRTISQQMKRQGKLLKWLRS